MSQNFPSSNIQIKPLSSPKYFLTQFNLSLHAVDKSKSRALGSQIQLRKELFNDVYSKRLERASIFSRDALDVICKTDHEDTFHYIDPPYLNTDMGHYGGYTIEDFEKLLRLLVSCQ